MKPDPLKHWRSRHTRESKTITVLETDCNLLLGSCNQIFGFSCNPPREFVSERYGILTFIFVQTAIAIGRYSLIN